MKCRRYADNSAYGSRYASLDNSRRTGVACSTREQNESVVASIDRTCARGRCGLCVRVRVPLHACVRDRSRFDLEDRTCCNNRCATPTICAAGWRGDFVSAGRRTTRGDRQLSRCGRPRRSVGRDRALGPHGVWTAAGCAYRISGAPVISQSFALQKLAGWETKRMVRCYAHLSGEHLAPHAERMAEHLGTFGAQSANDNNQKPRK